MNKLQQIRYSVLILCLMCTGIYAQKKTKTFKETFNVASNATLDINTSYTDIQFETWDKNEVVIEAIIEVEGATEEEAKDYFEKGNLDIKGNSKKIEITTAIEPKWLHNWNDIGLQNIEPLSIENLHNVLIDLPELLDIPVITELPPMPPIPIQSFDYEAYEKDGEKYLKKWKKAFDKSFDEDYKKKLEEWTERLEQREEQRAERRKAAYEAKHSRLLEKRHDRLKARTMILEERANARKHRAEILGHRIHHTDSLRSHPNIYFGTLNGKAKKYKVKKTIKIKMPKTVKIDMNVRHGEVRLAENTKNINATLSYARLLASTIEGNDTYISASYSPVIVQNWNYGQLKAEYSDEVNLYSAGNLVLRSNSSNITIHRLLENARIKSDFGPLEIKAIAKDFKDIDIALHNGELDCRLPNTSFTVHIQGDLSKFKVPKDMVLKTTTNGSTTTYKGYYKQANTSKAINIQSKYSDVVLKQ